VGRFAVGGACDAEGLVVADGMAARGGRRGGGRDKRGIKFIEIRHD
jgi:hypothetical protein